MGFGTHSISETKNPGGLLHRGQLFWHMSTFRSRLDNKCYRSCRLSGQPCEAELFPYLRIAECTLPLAPMGQPPYFLRSWPNSLGPAPGPPPLSIFETDWERGERWAFFHSHGGGPIATAMRFPIPLPSATQRRTTHRQSLQRRRHPFTSTNCRILLSFRYTH